MKQELLNKISFLSKELKEIHEKTHDIFTSAESLSAGLIGASIVETSGSSDWFDCGFITYSNEAKIKLLNVKEQSLIDHGAVSLEVAKEMAEGALLNSPLATVSVSVTGIAGPTGGSALKPVGTVWMGISKKGSETLTYCHHFTGDREEIRLKTVLAALTALKQVSLGLDLNFSNI